MCFVSIVCVYVPHCTMCVMCVCAMRVYVQYVECCSRAADVLCRRIAMDYVIKYRIRQNLANDWVLSSFVATRRKDLNWPTISVFEFDPFCPRSLLSVGYRWHVDGWTGATSSIICSIIINSKCSIIFWMLNAAWYAVIRNISLCMLWWWWHRS